MIITYKPEDDADPIVWNTKDREHRIMSREAAVIERHLDMNYKMQILPQAQTENVTCVRAIVWLLMKRSNPVLRWDDFDYPADAVSVELDRDELMEFRDRAMSMPMDAEKRAAVEAELDAKIAGAPESPKALSSAAATSTA